MTGNCGICDGECNHFISLLGVHICRECEQDIVNSDIGDIKYQYYKSVIKKLWIDYIIQFSQKV
ncbi:sigma factor G inhibitor Gin [Caldisalinibacter kiritimatiensis]|uniref:Inhibitor of sigma-G Gin n=1 Tax=Caldisalinibacter kiritimatiensis TaxID=1304284 RepID=R1CF84_9FIRM|nr:sigma factor G inhibitor Gin [Caldisalinibacter kiritimatiensis]EOD00950.1 hypothetical protein L21TH_0987 [Caldisalinibacter kiritimatiensis]